jgi:hypothetical protein
MRSTGIDGHPSTPVNGNDVDGEYSYCTNGNGIKEAGYLETKDDSISGHTAVPYRHLFVWSSYDQGKYA